MTNDYEGQITLEVWDEGGDVISWYLRRHSDDATRYVSSFGPEGMLSPGQGLRPEGWYAPERVGLSTIKDH